MDAILSVAMLVAAITPSFGVREPSNFEFPGLLAELRRADAIVRFQTTTLERDSVLGRDPKTKTWARVSLGGDVLAVFGDGRLRAGDSITASAWYGQLNSQARELTDVTHQFVFTVVPIVGTEKILLLSRTPSGWDVGRSLSCGPENVAFLEHYIRLASLGDREAQPALIRMLLDEVVSERQNWGHVRVMLLDLYHLNALAPDAEWIWRKEVLSRADHFIDLAGIGDAALFSRLVQFLPESKQRRCVGGLLQAHQDLVEELEHLKGVDMEPEEMTYELHRFLSASIGRTVLIQAMEVLLPPEEPRGWENREAREDSVLARARRYALP